MIKKHAGEELGSNHINTINNKYYLQYGYVLIKYQIHNGVYSLSK